MLNIRTEIMIKSNESFVILPVLTALNEITQEENFEEFKAVTGKVLNLEGTKSLLNFSLSGFIPSKNYEFMNGNNFTLLTTLKFLEKNKGKIVRIIVINSNLVVLNIQARYKMSYSLTDKAGDVPFTLDITEFKSPNAGKGGIINDYIY